MAMLAPAIEVATSGTVAAGGAMGTRGGRSVGPGTADPGDFPDGGRRDPFGDAARAAALLALLKSIANILTNPYKDNKDEDEKKCKTFTYDKRGTECKGGKAHHIVPDRDWRSPGARGVWTNVAPIDAALNNARQGIPLLGKIWKGGYYYQKMDEGSGLCICMTEKEHLLVHAIHDPAEAILGKNSSPKDTTNLKTAEELSAKSVAAVTGCNETKLLNSLKDHHRGLGFNDDTLLRADPYGNSGLDADKFLNAMKEASKQKSGSVGF